MIMELINGRELFSIICDETEFEILTENILINFVKKITIGLKYLHSKNM